MTVHQTMDDGTVFPELNVTLSEDRRANTCGTSNQVGDEVHRNNMDSPANLRMKSSADPAPGFDCDQRSLDRAQFETMSNRSGHDKDQWKWLLLLILVTGIVTWFLVQNKFTRTEPLFRTTKVTRGDIRQTVTATGEIDPASYKAALAYAEGNLANAEAARDLARIRARRQEELLRRHMVAPSDYDQAIATLKQDEAQVKMRQADLEKATVDRVLDSSPL